jgi:hypothetical protein
MKEKTYTIGGREFSLARPTARQQRNTNRILREATAICQVDAQGSDNPLLIYAELWFALVEAESVHTFLANILVPLGSTWSEDIVTETAAFLVVADFTEVSGLFTEVASDFFSANPPLTRNMVISLLGSIKNSERLLPRLVRMAETMKGSTRRPAEKSTISM